MSRIGLAPKSSQASRASQRFFLSVAGAGIAMAAKALKKQVKTSHYRIFLPSKLPTGDFCTRFDSEFHRKLRRFHPKVREFRQDGGVSAVRTPDL
jgi:hypothetical protein